LNESKFNMKRFGKIVLSVAVLAAAIFFIANAVARDWSAVQEFEWKLNFGLLTASVLVGCSAGFVTIKVMQRIMKAFGGRVPFSRFAFFAMLSNFGKYIPGKVAQIASILILLKREGIPRLMTLATMVVFEIMLIMVPIIVGIVLVGPEVVREFALNVPFWVFGIIALIGILFTLPPVMQFLAKKLLAIFKRESVEYDLSYRDWAVAIAAMFFAWILYSISFALLVAGLVDIPAGSCMLVAGAFSLAYTIGLLVIVTPGGLGVREGILLLILATVFPSGVAGLIATAARLWILIIELVSLGIAFVIFRISGKGKVSQYIHKREDEVI